MASMRWAHSRHAIRPYRPVLSRSDRCQQLTTVEQFWCNSYLTISLKKLMSIIPVLTNHFLIVREPSQATEGGRNWGIRGTGISTLIVNDVSSVSAMPENRATVRDSGHQRAGETALNRGICGQKLFITWNIWSALVSYEGLTHWNQNTRIVRNKWTNNEVLWDWVKTVINVLVF